MKKFLILIISFLLLMGSDFQVNAATFSSWTQVATAKNWSSVSCSTNCEIAYATVNNEYIYKSVDAGLNWSQLTSGGSRAWSSIFTSLDGSAVTATVSGGYIYRSNDGGSTWTSLTNAGSRSWKAISGNSTANYLLAGVTSGSIWSSTDAGSTWVQQSSPGISSNWQGLDMSDDGSIVVASNNSGGIWRGTGSVGSWSWSNITSGKSATDGTALGSKNYRSLVLDSTGTKLAVVSEDMYFTSDSGATWIHATGGNYTWGSVSGNSDLTKMMMLSMDGVNINCRPHIVTTSNYTSFSDAIVGSVWVPYSSGAFARDGSRAIAATASSYLYQSGDVYVAVDSTPPTFTSSSSFSVAENISITTAAATVKVSESATVTISGGVDSSLFTISNSDSVTALIKFKVSPNYEAPSDSGGNNVYDLILTATDPSANAGTQTITITVTDVLDTSSFNSFALAGGVNTSTYRQAIQINASVTVASRITFKAGNVGIPGCKSILATGSGSTFTISCSWKPSKRGAVALTASSVPTNVAISGANSTPITVLVVNRVGPR